MELVPPLPERCHVFCRRGRVLGCAPRKTVTRSVKKTAYVTTTYTQAGSRVFGFVFWDKNSDGVYSKLQWQFLSSETLILLCYAKTIHLTKLWETP